ncbi:ATP-binding protein [Bifidobacterium biavatii]|uniref:AAA domain protein n=1 Tax=Bifidobacterium biavatii DSM 23969 TaxID=1437608 RepID=A0A087A126_9BIFI|nr:ATP-binding protein [Bifidobacterium biavatii]KFI52476.1 AAA domain protein [Bifidobacterium biavatii DSM 23969]
MIPRLLTEQVKRSAAWFPIVSVTGPRQSGKSTLVQHAFPDYTYLNLEDPELRNQANVDPISFIRNRSTRLIIDEAQYAPDLFSMLQVVSDETKQPGQFILSGSQNFLLLKQIKQSLAGRVGVLKLLPLSYAETLTARPELTIEEFTLTGGYPHLHSAHVPRGIFFESYLNSYIERDVADYLDVRNLTMFRTFLRLCAQHVGGLIKETTFANELGITYRTVKSWMSILESSYITFSLPPYFGNLNKRLTKTPKLYFYDTGLLCHLLRIETVQDLQEHPLFGEIIENLVISETVKRYYNALKTPELYFYRDDSKIEVDLIDCTRSQTKPELIEIKSGRMYHDRFAKHLRSIGTLLNVPDENRTVAMRVDKPYTDHDVNICPIRELLLKAEDPVS